MNNVAHVRTGNLDVEDVLPFRNRKHCASDPSSERKDTVSLRALCAMVTLFAATIATPSETANAEETISVAVPSSLNVEAPTILIVKPVANVTLTERY